MSIIYDLKWRYATKKFDRKKRISKKILEEVIDALVLTPSSLGLQPWKFLIVSNRELQETLRESSYNQSQVGDCSHYIILCRINNIDEFFVDKHIERTCELRKKEKKDRSTYKELVKNNILSKTDEEKELWAKEQIFIALGSLLTILAVKKIDSCPIGGFDKKQYDKILDLKEKNLAPVICVAVGYRSSEDDHAFDAKVRFDKTEIIKLVE